MRSARRNTLLCRALIELDTRYRAYQHSKLASYAADIFVNPSVGYIKGLNSLKTKWKCFSIQCLSISGRTFFIVIVNDDQQDATILVYLFIPNQLYMFRAMSSPIIMVIIYSYTNDARTGES